MFDIVHKLFGTGAGEASAPHDARRAVSGLLVMAARSDGTYDSGEKAVIDKVLSSRYGLSPEDAAALRAEGEADEADSIDLYQFTRAVREAVPIENRFDLLVSLWRVVLADEHRDPLEDALMRQLGDRLGLSPMDLAQARLVVAKGS